MANLRDIRNRIDSVENTKQITRAMKMVAAAKLRRAQERIFETRPYAYKLRLIIQHLREHTEPTRHPWFAEDGEEADDAGATNVNRVLIVVITSDRGLCGAFNSNVFQLTEETIEEEYRRIFDRGDGSLLCLGSKGHDHFRRRGMSQVGDYRQFFDPLSFAHTVAVVDRIVDGYESGRWDEVKIVYNEFRNTISQDRIVEPLLPISTARFLTPAMEENLGSPGPRERRHAVDYLSEPDLQTLLEELMPRFVRFQLWRACLESNAAEQGARMAAMDNATSNATELLEELRLNYNRARQEAITTEILEIASGAEALSQEE